MVPGGTRSDFRNSNEAVLPGSRQLLEPAALGQRLTMMPQNRLAQLLAQSGQ
jgi:hypothetical protein